MSAAQVPSPITVSFGHREDAIDIGWRAPKQIDAINPVGDQAAGGTTRAIAASRL